jgi:intracellular sulfur oxidation DsrE/DsrF family protein
MSRQSPSSPERRSFLTGRNAGVTSIAAMAIGGAALVQGKSTKPTRWEPARHEKDDWLDQVPGKHRLVFDTTMPDGMGDAIGFANNFMNVNQSDYGLQDNDLAVVIVARHASTPFAYNDAMWAKYGAAMKGLTKFDDPKSKVPPKVNVYNSKDYGDLLPNRGVTLDSLAKRGVRFAVCSMATRFIAGMLAGAVGGNADAINSELIANLVKNARMVPAGIIAVNRAQERGYSLATA